MTANEFNLLEAIEDGNCSLVISILDCPNVDIEQRDQNGQTPLILAAERGNVQLVHELLKRNVNVNAQDEDGWTALIAGCKEGHLEVVKELLEFGAKVQLADLGGWFPLTWCSYKGHGNVVSELLAYGANPNEKGQHGMTALIWASGRGHTQVVEELLDAGADANSADKYGTSALVWATRKGHKDVVEKLLEKGADVDTAGTRGWTPLIMAAKGGYGEVVDSLLARDSNVNATDQEGYSALAWAAKQGHDEIVQKLLSRGAYFSLPDKEGDTVLISASRDGHLEVVRTLLSKYADVDAVDSEGKTALFHAVEKGHAGIVKELLDAGANTEIANRDSETPLLCATQRKHTEIVSLLLEKGASVSTADKRGDTAIHLAVRGRYRRICEQLLRNPKDARLLYRPNKVGETPYNIDRQHKHSILTQIFGTGLFSTDKRCSDEVMGYDMYTSALADVLCEPSLNMPLSVGMYARWGSGKSVVLRRLQDEMKEFAHQDLRTIFQFSRFIFILVMLLSAVVGVILWAAVNLLCGIGVGITLFISCYVLFLCAYVADRRYSGSKTSCSVGGYVAKAVAVLKLLAQLMFCVPPCPSALKPALPVRFLFTDFSKLTCSGSEAASLVGMIETLCDVIESEFGFFVSRLYRVFRAQSSEYDESILAEARWKRCCCCIPTFIVFLFVLTCGIVGLSLYNAYEGKQSPSAVTGIEITCATVVGVALLVHLPTFCSILYSLVFSQKKRISVVATQLGLKEEGFIHALKQEVELLTDLVNCVDGFTRHQTRIVIVIDGLDSSEQSKVLQLLDSVNLLFTDPEAPFIILMALDPRVIIRAIDQSFNSILRESHISASDYLKSIVQLPFYLPEPKSNYTGVLPAHIRSLLEDVGGHQGSHQGEEPGQDHEQAEGGEESPHSMTADLEWDGEMLHYDSERDKHVFPHRMQPRDHQNCNGGLPLRVHPDLELHPSMLYEPSETDPCLLHQKVMERELEMEERRKMSADLAQVLADNETVNPLGIKRLMNIVSLTSRLLRARGVDYSWKRLAAWVSLVDGWPYRTSWLVLLVEDTSTRFGDEVALKDMYEATLSAVPTINEVDCAVDGDPVYFETFLASHQPLLSVGDLQRFLACTIHLDPSLRRQMVECLQLNVNSNQMKSENESIVGGKSSNYQLQVINRDDKQVNLAPLTVEDVCKQLSELEGLDRKQVSTYQATITENNINGKVLATCDLNELGQLMGMTFGDWQLLRAWILNSRLQECGGYQPCHPNSRCVSPGDMHCQLLQSSSGACIDVCVEHSNLLNAPGTKSTAGSALVSSDNNRVEQQPPPLPQVQALMPNGSVVSGNGADADVPEIVLHPPSAPETEEEDNCETSDVKVERDAKAEKEPPSARVKSFAVGTHGRETVENNINSSRKEDEVDGRDKRVSGNSLNDDQDELPPLPDAPPECLDGDEDDDFPAPPPCPDEDLIIFGETEEQNEQNEQTKETKQEEEKEKDASEGETQNDGGCEMVWTMRQVARAGPPRVPPARPPKRSPSTVSAQSAPGNFAVSLECECEQLGRPEPIDSSSSKSSLFYDPPVSATVVRPAPIVITANRNGPAQTAVAVTRSPSNSGVEGNTAPRNPYPYSGPSYSETKGSQNSGTLPNISKKHNLSPGGVDDGLRQRPTSDVGMDKVASENTRKDVPALVPPAMHQRATSEGRMGPVSSFHPEPLFHEPSAFKPRRPHEPSPSHIHNQHSTTLPLSTQDDSVWVPLTQRFQLDKDARSFSEPEEPFQRRRPRPWTAQDNSETSPPKFRTYTPQPKPSRRNSAGESKKGNETCV